MSCCEHEFVDDICQDCGVKRYSIPKVPSDTRESIPSAPTLDGWPVIQQGYLVIDDHCEDGHWSGYASSRGGGNIVWDTEALPITVHARTKGVNLIADSEIEEGAKLDPIHKRTILWMKDRIAELEQELNNIKTKWQQEDLDLASQYAKVMQSKLAPDMRIATLEKELAIERQRSEVRGQSLLEATAEVERLKKENEIKLDKWLDHGSDMMEELERLRPENKRLQSKLAKATAALKLAQEHIHEEFCGSKHHEYCIAVGDTLAEIGGKK